MGDVIVLDEGTANRIAAGEVVERPSSVIKELAENALDAGAARINIDIYNGGITRMAVADEGSGIYDDDVLLAFERHATSKLRVAEDLERVTTLGFRGEALPSIASVSKLRMVTRRRGAEYGRLVEFHAGRLVRDEIAGRPHGTTVTVSELFYNLPARYKFLKKDAAEAANISELVGRLAIGRPDVSFTLTSQDVRLLYTQGGGKPEDAVFAVWGADMLSGLIPVAPRRAPDSAYSVSGFAGRPEYARANRNYQLFYINGRAVKNRSLYSAIETAYKSRIPGRRHPAVVLYIEMDAWLVDVNAHPAKTEVRFRNEADLYRAVCHAVESALNGINRAATGFFGESNRNPTDNDYVADRNPADRIYFGDDARLSARERAPIPADAPAGATQIRLPAAYTGPGTAEARPAPPGTIAENPAIAENPPIAEKPPIAENPSVAENPSIAENPSDEGSLSDADNLPGVGDSVISENYTHTRTAAENPSIAIGPAPGLADGAGPETGLFDGASYIGQLFNAYLLLENDRTLLLIDQHAAHERLLYERIRAQYGKKTIPRQVLLESITISLTPDEMVFTGEAARFLSDAGFVFEEFGRDAVILREVPVYMERPDVKNFFLDVLETARRELQRDGAGGGASASHDRLLYDVACKAAIKSNRRLSAGEVSELVRSLNALPQPLTCPHGRPLVVALPKRDFDKMFKRI